MKPRRPAALAAMAMLATAAAMPAATALGAGEPPMLKPAGQADFREYQEALDHRAFAIAPGGAWGWKFGQPTRAAAEQGALKECQVNSHWPCQLYDVGGRNVLDAKAWASIWRPYLPAAKAAKAAVGREVGQRLPDLAWTDAAGKPAALSGLRGKVVVLHLWASWCGPCRREMPEIQQLYENLAGHADIVFVPLQLRETHAVALKWAQAQGFRLPYGDSGSTGSEDAFLRLKGGGKLPDRDIAPGFPTTYVLDRNGVVVFSHVGDMHGWPFYAAPLRDLMTSAPR